MPEKISEACRVMQLHCSVKRDNNTAMYKKIGADLWAIGNNHSMDSGAEGVISTRKMYNPFK